MIPHKTMGYFMTVIVIAQCHSGINGTKQTKSPEDKVCLLTVINPGHLIGLLLLHICTCAGRCGSLIVHAAHPYMCKC